MRQAADIVHETLVLGPLALALGAHSCSRTHSATTDEFNPFSPSVAARHGNEMVQECVRSVCGFEPRRSSVGVRRRSPDDHWRSYPAPAVILSLLRNVSEAMVGVHDRPRHLLISTAREDGDRARVSLGDAGVGLDRQSMDSFSIPAVHTA
jgi:hypothetical protein